MGIISGWVKIKAAGSQFREYSMYIYKIQNICLFKKLKESWGLYWSLWETESSIETNENISQCPLFFIHHSDNFDQALGMLVLSRVVIKSWVETLSD